MTLFDLFRLGPVWNTAPEGGNGSPAPAATPAPEGGTGAPAAAGEPGAGNESGETPAPGNLVADGAPQPEGGQTGDGGDEFVPVTMDNLSIPEGVELADEAMTDFLGIMNNQELDPAARTQQLIDLQLREAQKATESATQAAETLWNETQTQWQEQARALPGIGGEQLEQSLATIKDGLKAAGATDATFEALALTGAGNHPEIIRVLHTLTKGATESAPVMGEGAGTGRKLSPAEILFGNSQGAK